MNEETPKIIFIHSCLHCGTQLSPKQVTFRCSNCGATTFKLKKIKKEIKKTSPKVEDNTQGKSSETYPTTIKSFTITAENTVEDEKSEKGLETIKLDRIGVFDIDVDGLMSGKPLILSVKEGFYEISVHKLMEKVRRRYRKSL